MTDYPTQNVINASVAVENLECWLGHGLTADESQEQSRAILDALTAAEQQELKRYLVGLADERPPAQLPYWLNNTLRLLRETKP